VRGHFTFCLLLGFGEIAGFWENDDIKLLWTRVMKVMDPRKLHPFCLLLGFGEIAGFWENDDIKLSWTRVMKVMKVMVRLCSQESWTNAWETKPFISASHPHYQSYKSRCS
jgi:hypothetical protein